MHVEIGKYPKNISIHSVVSSLFFWTKDKPDLCDKISEFLTYGSIEKEHEVNEEFTLGGRKETFLAKIFQFFNNKKQQYVNVRIDEHDTYSADYTLGLIILPVLEQLKEHKQGAPDVDLSDVPDYLKPTEEEIQLYKNKGEVDDKFFDRWDYVLDEMIFAFETKSGDLQGWEEQFYTHTGDMTFKQLENGYSELISSGCKIDTKGLIEYEKRILNGFRLFGKYYTNLWS